MKKMLLQMTAAQLLMQVILTLYLWLGHLVSDGQIPDFSAVVMLLIAGVPSVLFCMLEPALRVQNHCRKRWRHVTACLFFWGLESAAFVLIAVKLTASGLFPPCENSEAEKFWILPVFAFVISGVLVPFWLLTEWFREKRTARLYGGHDSAEE